MTGLARSFHIMIDTNALLNFAFSIVATFTNAVSVPPEAVPQSVQDLASYTIGRGPFFPIDVYLRHKRGTHFIIGNGAVSYYTNPRSYFHLQDPELIPQWTGTAKLTTNEVVELATRTVRALVKSGDPLTNGGPVIRAAGYYQGRLIPFYQISWPHPIWRDTATVEVDARDGMIVTVDLLHDCFEDQDLAERIKSQVYRPEPPPSLPAGRKSLLPVPERKDVERAIATWLRTCPQIWIHPGSYTNLADVDWDESVVYRLPSFTRKPICRVAFRNGTQFDAVDGGVINHGSTNCYYPPVEYGWKRFQGRINYRWQELAERFQKRLETHFGMTERALSRFQAEPHRLVEEKVGDRGLTRVEVIWYARSKRPSMTHKHDRAVGFMAEFDLESGRVEGFGFHDPDLIKAFCRAQRKEENNVSKFGPQY